MRVLGVASLLSLLAACSELPVIRIFVNTSVSIPDEMNEVHVEIAASSPEGRVCRERIGLFNLGAQTDLPIYIRLEQGSMYTESIMYRVAGLLNDRDVLEGQTGWEPWPSEGERDIYVRLESECLLSNLGERCEELEHCIDGSCEDFVLPEEFEDPEAFDGDISCWDE